MTTEPIRNMEEFAARCGVSRPTVSKYFNDPASVRPGVRDRIEKAIARYQFRPNMYAVNQNRRLTKTIGIVVPYLADPFFAEISRYIENRVIEAGYSPSLFSSHGSQALESEALDTLKAMKASGLLFAPLGLLSDRTVIEQFTKTVPTVLFDSNLDDVGSAFVGLNNAQSVPMMVEHLCRTGSPPCFVEMPPVNPNVDNRRNAYISAMERLDQDPKVIRIDGNDWNFEEIGFREGGALIADDRLPSTTVLCSNDRLAIGLLAAAYEQGKRVGTGPDCDLRIAGHDDHPFSRFTCPALTTVAQDYDAISSHSVETLVSLMEGGQEQDRRAETLYEGRLVIRKSA